METSGTQGVDLIRFIDPETEDDWPRETPVGIRRYLTGLAQHSPVHFMENAKGLVAKVLRVNDKVLPILISDGAPGKASILSPTGHHVHYPIEEIARQSRFLNQTVLKAILLPLMLLFRTAALDRVVFINHWLLSGAPEPKVPQALWPDVIAYVARQFPDHAIVLQDVKPSLNRPLSSALQAAGGVFVPTRMVGIVDPKADLGGTKNKRKRHAQNVAKRLYEDTTKDLLSHAVVRRQIDRVRGLYAKSNLDNHSRLNPQYTEAFFELALTCDEFKIQAWHSDDTETVAAFNLQRLDENSIHWSTFGAEERGNPNDGQKHSLYERVAATDLSVAREKGLILDWGAGAEDFKKLRGAVPHAQYEVAFIQHLGLWRRLGWRVLAELRTFRQKQLQSRDTCG